MHYQRLPAIVSVLLITVSGTFFSASATAKNKPDQQQILNEGYSILYSGVSGLSRTDLLLDVKLESDATDKLVSDIADYLTELDSGLQKIAQENPGIRLDLKPLPAIERKTQSAATEARIKSFAPVTGRTGPGFERTLLLTLSGALNSLRHLTQIMAEAEKSHSQQRMAFLDDAHTHLNQLYDRVLHQLNNRFFIHDAFAGKSDETDKAGDSGHKESGK